MGWSWVCPGPPPCAARAAEAGRRQRGGDHQACAPGRAQATNESGLRTTGTQTEEAFLMSGNWRTVFLVCVFNNWYDRMMVCI